MSLYGPTLHVTTVDLCIIFQCNLYISCILSCGNKIVFQIVFQNCVVPVWHSMRHLPPHRSPVRMANVTQGSSCVLYTASPATMRIACAHGARHTRKFLNSVHNALPIRHHVHHILYTYSANHTREFVYDIMYRA